MKKIILLFVLCLVATLLLSQSTMRNPFGNPGCQSPGCVPNLQFWFSADCITYTSSVCGTPSNGTSISSWADHSGNSNNLSKTSGTCTYTANQINGHPDVVFSSCILSLTNAIAAQCCHHLFAVIQLASTSTTVTLVGGTSHACEFTYDFPTSGGSYQLVNIQNASGGATGLHSPDLNWHQVGFYYPNIGTAAPRIDRTSDTNTNPGGNCTGPITVIGEDPTPAFVFSGNIAEIIYYQDNANDPVSAANITVIETYLHTKYGL